MKLSRTSLYRMMAAGRFPRPVRLGSRAVAWRVAEVDEWLANRERVDYDGSAGA